MSQYCDAVLREIEICVPVTITTLPLTRGPLESGAIFLSKGMFSNVPWSGIGETSCSLRAARRRFAEDVMIVADIFN